MNEPPPWMDEAPPYDHPSNGATAPAHQGGKKEWKGKNQAPAMTAEQTAAAVEGFYEWLTAKETRAQLAVVLPDHVDVDVFLATARTAVLNKPELAQDSLRPSLLLATMKAAGQGLLPDGKQGALLPRYNSEKKCREVSWQPMVWGVVKLGRETGAIQNIRAVIVFHGEKFRIVQGDEDRIEHEVDIDIADEAYESLRAGADQWGNPKANPDAFFSRVRAAYCIIDGTEGKPVKRWMTRARISSLREASKAASGPWNSRWIDEMICKGMILFTSKWIDLDPSSAPAQRFRAALMTDMEVDFDREGNTAAIGQDEKPGQALLSAPDTKLDALEIQLGLRAKQTAPVEPEVGRLQPTSTAPGAQVGDALVAASPTDPKAAAGAVEHAQKDAGDGDAAAQAGGGDRTSPPAANEPTYLDRATTALSVGWEDPRWMKTLPKVLAACPTIADLATVQKLPAVKSAMTDAPPADRSNIAALFKAASERLATADDNDFPGDRP